MIGASAAEQAGAEEEADEGAGGFWHGCPTERAAAETELALVGHRSIGGDVAGEVGRREQTLQRIGAAADREEVRPMPAATAQNQPIPPGTIQFAGSGTGDLVHSLKNSVMISLLR